MSLVITVSGISGSGKTTIVENAVKNNPKKFHKVVTTTTRSAREGEIEGLDYFFMNKHDFEKKINEGFFLEHEFISGNFYGTQINQLINKKTIPIIIVGPEGAQNFKKILKDKNIDCISIFIECDIETAKERIKKRDCSNPIAVLKRLDNIDNFEYKWKDYNYSFRLPEGSNYEDFISIIEDYIQQNQVEKKNKLGKKNKIK